MAFHSKDKTTSRDLDHASNLVLSWMDFWKTFEKINTGSETFLQLREIYERREDEGQRPPWKELKVFRQIKNKEKANA